MLLTVSGPPGGGKTTAARALADEFGFDHVSGGDIFRSVATERDLSLAELNALAEEDPSIDLDLDRRLRTTARDRDDLVLESRLAGWMAGSYADLRIWLDAPFEVRVKRIAEREEKSIEQVREETATRERSEKARYREYYDIDFEDRSIYDLAENTARWSPESMVDIVIAAVKAYDPGSDEGAVQIDIEFPS